MKKIDETYETKKVTAFLRRAAGQNRGAPRLSRGASLKSLLRREA